MSPSVGMAVDYRDRGAKDYINMIHSKATLAWTAGLKVVTSKCAQCHRSLALRHFAAQKAGIKMHGCWYCSSTCFVAAAEKKLSSLLTLSEEQPSHISRMPLGLILVSQGVLTRSQFREVLDKQKVTGGEIGELLARQGPASEKQVAAARSTQWGCPVFAVPKHGIQTPIQIPSILIRLHSVIPLHYVSAKKLLLVGFVNDIEYGLLYVIEQMTGCKTQPCFITPSDFQLQMQQRELALEQSAKTPLKEMTFEIVQTLTEMAYILCDYAADLEANEVIIGRFTEYLWARFKCDDREVDILFKVG